MINDDVDDGKVVDDCSGHDHEEGNGGKFDDDDNDDDLYVCLFVFLVYFLCCFSLVLFFLFCLSFFLFCYYHFYDHACLSISPFN